mgnify:CR=1 FL=1
MVAVSGTILAIEAASALITLSIAASQIRHDRGQSPRSFSEGSIMKDAITRTEFLEYLFQQEKDCRAAAERIKLQRARLKDHRVTTEQSQEEKGY